MMGKKFGTLGLLLCTVLTAQSAKAAVTLFDKGGWKVNSSGFVELDTIWDTTRSLTEVTGNNPIDLPTTANGANGRAQFSLRNTRLGFGVEAPETCGVKTRGYIETDFLGYDPNPSSVAPTNSENSFFTSPTLRIRHAFFQAERGGLQLLAGQYWNLFGWQPSYFLPTEEVQPIASMLYARTPQMRLTQTMKFDDVATLDIALAMLRPPQRDSLIPDFQGGIRLAFDGWTAAHTNGAAAPVKQMPLSLGASALIRKIAATGNGAAPNNTLTTNVGWAVAGNAFLPIYSDLGVSGEFTYGSGYGDQYNSWTGNLANPITAPSNLDGGIGGYDSTGAFHLVDMYGWNVAGQWHLPWIRTYLNLGMGQLYSSNMNLIIVPAGKTAYNRSMVIFANIVHNFTDHIRAGFEYAYSETGYITSAIGYNNRYQLTAHFIW